MKWYQPQWLSVNVPRCDTNTVTSKRHSFVDSTVPVLSLAKTPGERWRKLFALLTSLPSRVFIFFSFHKEVGRRSAPSVRSCRPPPSNTRTHIQTATWVMGWPTPWRLKNAKFSPTRRKQHCASDIWLCGVVLEKGTLPGHPESPHVLVILITSFPLSTNISQFCMLLSCLHKSTSTVN